MSKEFWHEFIQIFKENTCLWDEKCADYANYLKTNIAYGLLVEKMWEVYDNADTETVQVKISSLTKDYRMEKERIAKAKKIGKKVEPVWEYYQCLRFLDSDEEESSVPESTVQDANVEGVVLGSSNQPGDARGSPSKPSNNQHVPEERPLKRKRSSQDYVEDENSTFAAYVKTRMRNFDTTQRCIAQKLIADVLFFAETKQLQMTTCIMNLDKS